MIPRNLKSNSRLPLVSLAVLAFSVLLGLGARKIPRNVNAAPWPGSNRTTIFISDLHLGVGKNPDGKWNNFEDARWAKEFALFLREMNRRGNGVSDLILNGDTFELWQSLENDCLYQDKDLSCTEKDALRRLKVVLSSHQAELRAIHDFALAGDNRVVIVPGNHDAAILFTRVAEEVLRAVGAPQERVRIAADGFWISSDNLLYAEHGHEIGKDLNRFDPWPKPFRTDTTGQSHILRPWGEQFVQRFFNDFEQKYPVIDNFSEDMWGVRYGLAAEGPAISTADFGQFVRFFLTELSWRQIQDTLGPADQIPDWNIKEIRSLGDRFLIDSIPQNDPLRLPAEKALAEGNFGVSLSQLSDDEIKSICSLREQMHEQQQNEKVPVPVSACPRTSPSLGAGTEKLFSSRNAVFTEHLTQTQKRLSDLGTGNAAFEVFVYSHTHREEGQFKPMQDSPWQPRVVNTGAWQRTVRPNEFEAIRKTKQLTVKKALGKIEPEDLPACYPFILIDPYPQHPQEALRYWRTDQDGKWMMGDSCGTR
jgi:UDP-2,3-diacylglucosamine pyrophosphatase LpxH